MIPNWTLNRLLEGHIPADHVLRAIEAIIDLFSIRTYLIEFYSSTGRPSIDLCAEQ